MGPHDGKNLPELSKIAALCGIGPNYTSDEYRQRIVAWREANITYLDLVKMKSLQKRDYATFYKGEILRVISRDAGLLRIVDFEGHEVYDCPEVLVDKSGIPHPPFGLVLLKNKLPAGFYENKEVTPTRENGKMPTSINGNDPDCESERKQLKTEYQALRDELELLREAQIAGLSEAEKKAIRKEYEEAKKALDDCNEEKKADREKYEASDEAKRIRDGIQPMKVQFDAEFAGLQNEVASLKVQLADCEKDVNGEEIAVKGPASKKRKRGDEPESAERKHVKKSS